MPENDEPHKRSVWKSVTYRIICIITVVILSYAFTGSYVITFWFTLTHQTVQTVFYYLHERAYDKWWPLA